MHKPVFSVTRWRAACGLLIALGVAGASAQEPPFNVELVSQFDQAGQVYADVWGEGTFAYVAHFGQNRVDIVDISDPANPVLAATYVAGSPDNGASAQDVKVANGLMFVGLEDPSTNSAHIVDVRDPYNPVKLTDVRISGFIAIHNLFYDNGWLYLADSRDPAVAIVDLRNYDPDNPPPLISSARWVLNNVGGTFVHDITVRNGRLYAAAWDSLQVYDVTNLATQPPQFLGSTPGTNTHSCWPTDDGRFVVTAEERTGGGLKLYEITDLGGSIDLTLRDTYALDTSRTISVHNPLILGDRIYASFYQAGVHVLQLLPDAGRMVLVASFDTTPRSGSGEFNGCWGVYPFLGEQTVLASDIEQGLFVLDVQPRVLLFSYPFGRPEFVDPLGGAPLTVQIDALGPPVDPATVTLHVRIDQGAETPIPMADLGNGLFGADLPPAECFSHLDYYISASNTEGDDFVDPPGAPQETYQAVVATGRVTVFTDDFETDRGWSVQNQNVSAGPWERGIPQGGGDRGDPPADFDGSGRLFETGLSDDEDLDGGPTILTSPAFDLSDSAGTLPRIGYAFWMFNDDGDDSLVVEVSNNDGASWVPVTVHTGGGGGWQVESFVVSDFVSPSDRVRVRFSVADQPNDSVTEAAIDAFFVERLLCESGPPGDFDGDGDVDIADFAFFSACFGGSGIPCAGDCCAADLDGDGDVDIADFSTFSANFTGSQ